MFHQVCRLKDLSETGEFAAEAIKQLQLTQFAMDHFTDYSVWLDEEGRIVYVNDATCRSLGYTRDELLSMMVWQIDPMHTPEKYAETWKFARTAGHVEFQGVNVTKDGRRFPIEVRASYICFGRLERLICFAHDITERMRSEEALKESEEKFRVLSELSPSAIFMYQGERLIYANPSAVRFTGFSQEELLAKSFWDMVHPEYREMVRMYGLMRQRGKSAPSRYEVMYVTRNGEERWAEFNAGLIEYRGMPAGIVTANDTTERKRTEIALHDAKDQAELYLDLMGHDINNMNQAALGFLEIAGEKLRSGDRLEARDLLMITGAIESLQNSSRLISSIRKLQKERKGVLKPEVVSLLPMLARLKEHYSKVPGRDITIVFNALCDCRVKANELLTDVFSNIVGNAIKHSSGPIAIGISLEITEERERLYCRVAVEDTGPGIPGAQKRTIFARAGREHAKLTGKGLGLYLVKTLVDDYRGRVWVEDRVSGDYTKGVRFVVLLPAVIGSGDDIAESVDVCGG